MANGTAVSFRLDRNNLSLLPNEIDFYNGDPSDVIADRIVDAIMSSRDLSGVTATNLNDGAVQINGATSVVMDGGGLQAALRLPLSLRFPGTNYARSGIDGQTFTVADGVNVPVTFEFDDDHRLGLGTQAIEFDTTDSDVELAAGGHRHRQRAVEPDGLREGCGRGHLPGRLGVQCLRR